MAAPRALTAFAVAAVLVALGTAVAEPAAATTTVEQGFRLLPGQSLTSTADGYRLTMQPDGNLVEYSNVGVPLWASGTAGRGASVLSLQADGNLVVRTSGGVATWASGARGTSLSVQDDGNTVLRSGSRAVWCTCAIPFQRVVGTPSSLTVGQGMLGGDHLVTGTRTLTLQTDGNLVLRDGSSATWTTGTATGSRSTLSLQTDGNLVLRDAARRAVWSSGTAGRGARTLRLGPDGGLQLLTASGAPVWAVGASPTGIAGDVFALLNRQRAANGLAALTSDPRLITAAAAHNARMSAAGTLAHQLPGEADPGARMAAAGYSWRAWAENIAWTTATTSAGAQAMQTAMYNETPPDDGHRQNILSRAVTQVGVAVLIDSHGRLWLTTDFAAPR